MARIYRLLFSLVLSSVSVVAYANVGSFAQSVCPALTEDAEQIISSIQSLRDQVDKRPECASLDQKLQNISKILSNRKWAGFKAVFNREDNVNLEGKEVEVMSGLIQEAAQNAAETVAMLVNKNSVCVANNQRASFITKFSGIVREVSAIAGNITGPYGMAVTLGGQFLASALEGIDKIHSRNRYDFKNPQNEQLFINQFCSFAEVQKDMYDYLGLSTREQELSILSDYLDKKIVDLEQNCPECDGYSIAWKTQESSTRIVKRILEDVRIVETGDDLNTQLYTRCKEMHRAFHTENSDFSQFISTLDNYENPLASATDRALIDEVVRTTTGLKDIFPGFQQCISLPPEEQLALSKSFNNLMRDEILPLNEEIFGQQQRSFRYEADRKYCGALGEYTENSLERRKWINSERDRVRAKLRNPNYSVATEKIREQKQALENRFVQKLVPQYIEHIVGRNIKTIHYFEEKFKEFKKTEERINGYDPRVLIAEMNRTMDHLSLAFDQTRTFNRYCEYMRYLLVTTPKTESLCAQNKKTLQGHYSEIAALDTDIAQRIVDANLWEKTPVVYQTSRVSEYANHIKSWNDRGESKWYLKFDSRCSRLTKIKD